ncbi:SH3 domain protein [Marinobacterium nitratireducens]|uniref:SH3 domain protein n=1 Tax=Marinobacterium nitratireducens TaxID=518897 RepID=A0A917ZFQ4_9GAMM|nr:TIGR04211 family SH3 domain-containing protein [Marinobacterium nitratireducens]GGO81189.1 SH3 domain protein [Marinobacterium nitratireducens]
MTRILDFRGLKYLAASLTLVAALPASAQTGHIADDVYTYYHSGPSNQYRITGRIRSGEPVEILKRNSDTDYVQIRMENGKTGWLPGEHVAEGPSTLARLPQLEEALSEKQATASEQEREIDTLRAELNQLRSETQTYSSERQALNSQIEDLNRQIQNMDEGNLMRWFTHGGLVALGGVLLGLLVPYFPKKRKRRDDWF